MRCAAADAAWAALDDPWREAFAQAWEALRAGSIPVGACINDADGRLVHAARNRTGENSGPPGEVWGCSLAHAEINALAGVPFRHGRPLTITTTLEPCLQCAAAIRLARVGTVRFAGSDSYWSGCHRFERRLPDAPGRNTPTAREGPLAGELGRFGTLIAFPGPALSEQTSEWMRAHGSGTLLDLAAELRDDVDRLAALAVPDALAELWPRLGAVDAA